MGGERAAESRAGVYVLFALATIGAALGNLSQTGLNAMLPATMDDFGVAVDVGQWLTTGYMLMLGVAVPVATFLMQRLSDREYLLVSFGLFAAGSLIDCAAPEFFSMLFGRVLQAIAMGLLIPKNQTISMTKFPPGKQATAMGIAGIALGFAPNIGPTVGGALDSAFGWRSFFVLLAGVSGLLLVLTALLVKKGPADDSSALFETLSFVYSTIGFGGVLLGLSQASSYGLASGWVWAPVAVGAVGLVLFVRRQRVLGERTTCAKEPRAGDFASRLESGAGPSNMAGVGQVETVVESGLPGDPRAPLAEAASGERRRSSAAVQPLMDLRIFSSRTFNVGLLASVFLFACYMGVTLVIPLYVQDVLGGTSLDSGLVVFPATFTALVVNPLSGIMADKTSPRLVALIFGTFLVVGSVACVFIGEETPLWLLSVYQTTRAIGVSGLIGPLLTYALSGLEGPLVPHGSSASVVIRQVAATFGTAIMVFCVAALLPLAASGNVPSAMPYQVAFGFSAVMAILSLGVIVLRVR